MSPSVNDLLINGAFCNYFPYSANKLCNTHVVMALSPFSMGREAITIYLGGGGMGGAGFGCQQHAERLIQLPIRHLGGSRKFGRDPSRIWSSSAMSTDSRL